MRNLIATTEGRKEGKISAIENNQVAVWKKLKSLFNDGFYVDTYYNKIRVTTSRKEIIDFFENPHKIKVNTYNTEIIL